MHLCYGIQPMGCHKPFLSPLLPLSVVLQSSTVLFEMFWYILFHLPNKRISMCLLWNHMHWHTVNASGSLCLFSGESKLCSIQSFSHLGCFMPLSLHAGMYTLLKTIWCSCACFESKLFFRDKMYNFAYCWGSVIISFTEITELHKCVSLHKRHFDAFTYYLVRTQLFSVYNCIPFSIKILNMVYYGLTI